MNLKITFSTLFASTIVFAVSEAQLESKLKPVQVPQAYTEPDGRIAPQKTPRLSSNSGVYSGSYWIVYSDRDDNQTYKDKSCSTQPFQKINFQERFVVADETDSAIRLVEFDPFPIEDVSGSKKTFKATAKDAGWIKKSKMLLWSNCLVDTATRYAKKAIAVKRINDQEEFNKLIKRGVLDFYMAPVLEEKYEDEKKDVPLFRYMFIFKQEGDMVLLGTINVLKASSVGLDLYGWVKKSQIQEWNSAICLRVNFDEAAIQERTKDGIEPKFFRTEQNAIDYKEGRPSKSLQFLYSKIADNVADASNPYYLGYPITGKTSNPAVFKTGYVTNTVDKNGVNIFSAVLTAKLTQTWEQIKNEKEDVKIILVADAADRQLFKTLAKAINDEPIIGDSKMGNNKYQLGAIIMNGENCGEDGEFFTIQLKASKYVFTDALIEESNKKCDINRSKGAPIYDAIKKGCDLFANSKGTNILIVVGSVSSTDNAKREIALKALNDKKANVYFFQTINKNGVFEDRYFKDCRYFLEKRAVESDVVFADDIKNGKKKGARYLCQESESCKLYDCATTGEFYYKTGGVPLTAVEMKNDLRTILRDIETNLNVIKDLFERGIVGKGKNNRVENEDEIKEFESWLIDSKVSPDVIEKLSTMDNYQIFMEGYTALKPKSADYPIFERTLFVADKEFRKMKDVIDGIKDCYLAIEARQCVVSACKQIIYTYKGEMEPDRIAKMSIDDIYKLITGLPTSNPLFKKTLRDIEGKNTTDDQIQQMKNRFVQVSQLLKDLQRNPKYKYDTDDQLFYWVPERVLTID